MFFLFIESLLAIFEMCIRDRFQQFSRALLTDYDFIAENKNAIRHDDDARHCLLILDAEGTDGFLCLLYTSRCV